MINVHSDVDNLSLFVNFIHLYLNILLIKESASLCLKIGLEVSRLINQFCMFVGLGSMSG